MNKYVRYTYILLIIILIGSVKSSDKHPSRVSDDSTDDSDDNNFDTVVRELESLIEDHQAPGDTVVSDNLLQHGLGHITSHRYIEQPTDDHTPPEYQSPDESPATQHQPTTQDGKYYLIEPQPGKDGKYRLVPITHLEYIPATPEPQHEDTEPVEKLESESESPEEEDNFEVIVRGVENIVDEENQNPPAIEYKKVDWSAGVQTGSRKPYELPAIMFIGLNNDDELVPMTTSCYKIISFNFYLVKFKFGCRCVEILCNGKRVWSHRPGTSYPRTLIYNRKEDKFMVNFNNRIVSCSLKDGRWTEKVIYRPKELRLFTKTAEGLYCKLTHNKYNFHFTAFGSFKYVFNQGLTCDMIQINDEIVWQREENGPIVLKMSYFGPKYLRIYFEKFTMEIQNFEGEYKIKTFPNDKK
uniref:SVSP2 n=1 Tax=Theileria annulata TaxID=5874 RepID=D3XP31_THEAN|nr:SVSP2 [Theileria annulata]